MASYIPLTETDRAEMLKSIGLSDVMELFTDIPASILAEELPLASGKSEMEVRRVVSELAARNAVFPTVFRGAGAYRHYIPSIVKQISGKETFLTAYTPYQAEISQGILQMIFEYQSEICVLTGMDVSNASVYDGASGAAEATVMCRERARTRTLVAETAHPNIRSVISTYQSSSDHTVTFIPEFDGRIDVQALKNELTDDVASLYIQTPNFYGLIEDLDEVVAHCHAAGVKVIVGCNPIALSYLKTPGETGADIAVGEGQPLGLPLGFGGPYLGFMACKKELMRKLPGRIVGETTDHDGRRSFVLTLQAREQHIRREKALSSICTNEALCALSATVYLASMGPVGIRDAAAQCYAKSHYAASRLQKAGYTRRYQRDFFHEFITECPCDVETLLQQLAAQGILGGYPVAGGILWCVTECNTKEEIDRLVSICTKEAGR